MSHPRLPLVVALTGALAAPSRGNGWTPLTNQPPCQASTLLLLTDGRVLLQDYGTSHWWLLTPDIHGSYVNGSWSKAANSIDSRLGYASVLLADGRVLVCGGEVSSAGKETNHSEIYDPVGDTWTRVAPPAGWTNIGDPASSLLPDGTFIIGNEADTRTAIYDPVRDAWTAGPDKLRGTSDEESWVLLPDGSVVTADVTAHPGSERYVPSLGTWVDCNATPVDLVGASNEIGPGILMTDGRAFFMGATPHCCLYSFPTVNPGDPGSWVQGVDPPSRSGLPLGAPDAPAALLTNGNVLCALARIGPLGATPPTYFYEFDGNQFIAAPHPGNASGSQTLGRMLLLPTGELLYSESTIEAYTCDGAPLDAWRPTISSVPSDLLADESYALSGTQLNGLSQAVGYGDDASAATNYPLVRLTFHATGDVVYCRTFGHSTMAVATGAALVSTRFHVPFPVETGPAALEVVANGIASAPVEVVVRDRVKIDFDLLPAGVAITNQYPQATFLSESGFADWSLPLSDGNSLPNTLCTGPSGGGTDGVHDTYVDFPLPVDALTLDAIAVDGVGAVANVNVYERGAFNGSVSVTGAGTPLTPVHVDLTGFHDVTRVELTGITDPGGVAWDDFVFGIASATWNNYGAGFPGTGGVPSLTSRTNPVLGTTVTLDVGNSAGATTGALFMTGPAPAAIPTAKGGVLLVAPLRFVPLTLAPGGAQLSGSLPNDPTLCGIPLYAQVVEIDAGAAKGLSFTPGLELLLGY